ncbi:hypothetical protein EG68_11324 [Paragonimus skrjabini miyazakii]|uniref:MKRN2 opposite strand protein-like C-terminal domain-containing protein n=1 Tax=Paragonimus skrjabini miyazakii TaxID=59628 RepID=A0A8S9YCI8_9TREM|nr:hypothetical protein EG68_11324 [Paragonimus skrjabini miyazakii]
MFQSLVRFERSCCQSDLCGPTYTRHKNLVCTNSGQKPSVCEICGSTSCLTDPHSLPLPVESAHTSTLFRSSRVARIAFIPSNPRNRLFDFNETYQWHCGVVDSVGRVHSYSERSGTQADFTGWSEVIVINLPSVEFGFQNITAWQWDQAIRGVGFRSSYFRCNPYIAAHDEHKKDCLDYVAAVIGSVVRNETVDRTRVASWLHSRLRYLCWYRDLQNKLNVS